MINTSIRSLLYNINIRQLTYRLADLFIIWGAYCIYYFNSWYNNFLNNETLLILAGIGLFYSLISFLPKSNGHKDGARSIGYTFIHTLSSAIAFIIKQGKLPESLFRNEQDRKTFLFILVKLFFIPLMVQFLVGNIVDLTHDADRVLKTKMGYTAIHWFNNILFPLCIKTFFLVDTAFYCFGYLFESKYLKNQVRSVDKTWTGWLVALACYPPLNTIMTSISPHYGNMYAYFETSATATFFLRMAVLILILIYTSASVSLGTRCSNLTNRGIVQKGAYGIVRHPAYAAKVLAWWITLLPLLPYNTVALMGMAGWTILYFFRALTEERHLSADPEYVLYCEKVKYKFIPGIY